MLHNMSMNRSNLPSLCLAAALWLPLQAHATSDHAAHKAQAQATAPAAEMTDGEVRKLDKDAAKITLRHADIKHLDMPAMTQVVR